MATTEKDLDAKRQRVERLREQVRAEENKRLEREAALTNDVTAAQLDNEAARLEAQLAAAKEANKVAAVKDGAASVLDAVKAEQEAASAALNAPAEVPTTTAASDGKTKEG